MLWGFGLRVPHYEEALAWERAPCPLLEVISENFLGRGGRPCAVLRRARERCEIALHGVSLGIGNAAPLDEAYLRALRALADETEPLLVSDHLCFGGARGHYAHDLWPLPYTEEAVAHVVARLGEAQDALGRRIALENITTYVEHPGEMTESEFVAEIVRRSGCALLLDVNNLYLNAQNHGWSARAWLDAIPEGAVAQFHLAGHADRGSYLFDTHGSDVADPVWALYRHAVRRFGPAPAIVERDENIPPLAELVREASIAAEIAREPRIDTRELLEARAG